MVEADVAPLIRATKPPYDAILLDVDNGPEGMMQSVNDRLYSARGLAAARAALFRAECSPYGPRVPTAHSRRGSTRRDFRSRTSACAPAACTAARDM